MKGLKILVPLDGSSLAEATLPKAVEFVKQNNGGRLVLVRAVDPATLPGDVATGAQVVAINEAAEYLWGMTERLGDEGVGLVVRSVFCAAAGPAIVEAARAAKLDLIVMATHHRSGAGRLIPGPVAEFVLDRMCMPIVLVAADDTPVMVPPAGRGRAARIERDEKGNARARVA
ncbi:MAG: universal stress protein [Candidatus Rokuibacteriota bacterium]